MQFGVFSIADLLPDPVNHRQPSQAERLAGLRQIGLICEESGLDVFALGERHAPDYVVSLPTLLLAAVAAQTKRITMSTAVTLIATSDPVAIAEAYAMLQHLADGRLDLVLGGGDVAADHRWLGHALEPALDLALENYQLLHCLWNETNVQWDGRFRPPLVGYTSVPRPLDDTAPFVWHSAVCCREVADLAAFHGDGFHVNNLFGSELPFVDFVQHYRQRYEQYGHGRADQAIVGLGNKIFLARNSQEAISAFRPYFEAAPLYQQGLSLEEYAATPALAIGSPDQVIEKILTNRTTYGDYQRQMFLIDDAGVPLATALAQLELLASEVVPVLRAEFEALRPAGVPSDPPSHAELRGRTHLDDHSDWDQPTPVS